MARRWRACYTVRPSRSSLRSCYRVQVRCRGQGVHRRRTQHRIHRRRRQHWASEGEVYVLAGPCTRPLQVHFARTALACVGRRLPRAAWPRRAAPPACCVASARACTCASRAPRGLGACLHSRRRRPTQWAPWSTRPGEDPRSGRRGALLPYGPDKFRGVRRRLVW